MLCTFGPPEKRCKLWILKFEDQDKASMFFSNEIEAKAMFLRCADNWTCTLFVTEEIEEKNI
jgi:hypothetical protein